MRVRFNPNAKDELANFDRFIDSKEKINEILNKKAVCNDIYRADVRDYFALLVYQQHISW